MSRNSAHRDGIMMTRTANNISGFFWLLDLLLRFWCVFENYYG